MAAVICAIPVVDLQCFNTKTDCADEQMLENLATQVVDAFTSIGIVRLKNHGVSQAQVDNVMRKSEDFFKLDRQVKERYRQESVHVHHGWLSANRERVDPTGSTDLKEVYDVTLQHAKVWPDNEVPGFRTAMEQIHDQCHVLADRLLQLIAIGLKLEDRYIFRKKHNMSTKSNSTTLRSLYYPPIEEKADFSSNQLRLGEHTDYGTITLLFQDEAGGLELCTGDQTYIAAPPIAGTVLVNIGDLMQRWTADKLHSTKHRVVIPKEAMRRGRPRMSLVYFDHPDDECMIKCLDGSDKYPPIIAMDYFTQRLEATYFD